MEEFQKLYEELNTRRLQAQELKQVELEQDLENTLRRLNMFKGALLDDYNKQIESIIRKGTQKLVEGTGVPPFPKPIRLPILLINNEPVLNLFIYNIKAFYEKPEIVEKLNGLHIYDFHTAAKIKSLQHSKGLKIVCHNLRTSCEIQCSALLRRLTWSYASPSGVKSGHMMVCIDGVQAETGQVYLPVETVNENWLLSCLFQLGVSKEICKNLKVTDRNNLFVATYQIDPVFRAITYPALDVSLPAFIGKRTYFSIRAIQLFNPIKILFYPSQVPYSLHVVATILKAFRARNAQECEKSENKKVKRLIELNLTGVKVNEPLAKMISENFELQTLRLGEATQSFERFLKVEGTQRLYVENNINFLAICLYEIEFTQLKHLEIYNCERILLQSIISFLHNSKTLKKLIIINCITVDKDMHLLDFLETVFSSVHELDTFTFKHSVAPANEIS